MPNCRHQWNISVAEAIAIQKEWAAHVRQTPLHLEPTSIVVGLDISYARFSSVLHAGAIALRFGTLEVLESATVQAEARFPYIPGLLSFRELPAYLKVLAQLQIQPDVIVCDGQGLAHPRRFGLACHLGLWLDCPTFGCAKSLFVGKSETLTLAAGSVARLLDGEEEIGRVLRSKNKVKPVYVSVGHRIDLESAVAITRACVGGYRIPEPTRQAHLAVNRARTQYELATKPPT